MIQALLDISAASRNQPSYEMSNLQRANELAKGKGDFIIQSTHETASGRTEITVRRHSPVIWIVLGVAGLIVVAWLLR